MSWKNGCGRGSLNGGISASLSHAKGVFRAVLRKGVVSVRRHLARNPGVATPPRREVYDRSEGRCEACGRSISMQQMNAHHLRPFSAGGTNSLNNSACLCKGCHKLIHRHWPIQKGRWRNLRTVKIPRKHRGYLKWIFSWKKFPPTDNSCGSASVQDFTSGDLTEYKWRRGRWVCRICRGWRPRSTKAGRIVMQRIIRKWLWHSS